MSEVTHRESGSKRKTDQPTSTRKLESKRGRECEKGKKSKRVVSFIPHFLVNFVGGIITLAHSCCCCCARCMGSKGKERWWRWCYCCATHKPNCDLFLLTPYFLSQFIRAVPKPSTNANRISKTHLLPRVVEWNHFNKHYA